MVQNEVALSTEAEALVSRAHAILVSAGVVKSDATSASAAHQVQDMRLGHMPSMDELLRQVGGMDWATPISVVTQNAVSSGSENLEVA